MRQGRPSGTAMNVGLSTPAGSQRLKAHLVAGPSNHPPAYNRSFHPDASALTSGSLIKHNLTHASASPFLPTSGRIPVNAGIQCVSDGSSNLSVTGSASYNRMGVPVQLSSGHSTSDPHRGAQQYSLNKPTAPLPLRKQRTISPPVKVHTISSSPATTRQTSSHPTLMPVDTTRTKSGAFARQPHLKTFDGSSYGQSDSNSNSFISNRNSSGSSDIVNPASPIRTPRCTTIPDFTHIGATSLGIQTAAVSHHPSRDLFIQQQATVVRAPLVTPIVSTSSTCPTRSATSSIAPTHSSDCGSKMTVSELRSVAERQRQQLIRQAQQLQSKEERLAWLRSARAHASGEIASGCDNLPLPGSELSHEQEVRLHKLRSFRGQTEQTRLTNENLAKEIDHLSRFLSSKEGELESYRLRGEETRKLLALIDKCHSWLSKSSTPRTHRPVSSKLSWMSTLTDKTESDKSVLLLSVQLPFNSDRDKKRWRDGLLEADRLDRQITLALNNSAAQSKRHVQTMEAANLADSTHHKSQSGKGVVALQPPTLAPCSHSQIPTASGDRGTVCCVGDPVTSHVNPVTSKSEFSSLLSRASSPPTSRRSSLRMLLHAVHSGSMNYDSNNNTVSGTSQTIPPAFPRIKTPPRYASRAVINDTYMRRICRDSVEKYKRTASEIYRANVERMYARQSSPMSQQLSSSDSDKSTAVSSQNLASRADTEPGEVRLTESKIHAFHIDKSTNRVQSPVPDSLSSSSSSSSLELVGIEQSVEGSMSKTADHDLSPIDEEAKHSCGDMDSGLGGSDDTGQSEQTHISSGSTSVPKNGRIVTPAVVYVDDGPGTDASLSNASVVESASGHLKPILRKSVSQSSSEAKVLSSIEETTNAQSPSPNSSQPRSNSVRFHPLALLLDAALEGDIDLVKRAASQVTDVSEPNDEGITALHNAVCASRSDVADFLVRTAGADVNAGDTDGWTPLHCAASCGNLALARLLVEHGASLHARTLSDQETPLEKCDQGDDEAECEEYLFFQQERLGSAASGRVYALFPRGLEAAGPGSVDAHLQPDELAVYPNEPLTIIDREPMGETEWMLAEKSDGTRGLIPRSHISCYPLVRVPPASHPLPILPVKPQPFFLWDEDEEDVILQVNPPSEPSEPFSNATVEVEVPQTNSPALTSTSGPIATGESICITATSKLSVDDANKLPATSLALPDSNSADLNTAL